MSGLMMTIVIWSLALLVLFLGVFWVGQRRLMYFPTSDVPSPAAAGLTDVEPVTFNTADGLTLHAWFLRSGKSDRSGSVIVFNGNAGNRGYRADLGDRLRSLGLSVLLFDYRGFGENAGAPTESGLTLDARAARDYLLTRADVSRDRVVYFGESLGSAVATKLAVEEAPAALILRSPFTSFVDLGRIHYPLLPTRLLLRDRYATIDQIAKVRCPVLVVAGTRDAIVPFEQSKRVFEAAPYGSELATIEGADHNDDALGAGLEMIEAIARFLDRVGRQQ
jgi:uncharacterized protein